MKTPFKYAVSYVMALALGAGVLAMQGCAPSADFTDTTGDASAQSPADDAPSPDLTSAAPPSVDVGPLPDITAPPLNRADGEKNPQATIEMENGQKIVLVLFPDKAPNTVSNFISLANQGFYDGISFHRVAKDFMIQGGDPAGDGTGGPGYAITGEFAANGVAGNDISHLPGVISMARQGGTTAQPELGYNTAGSQFFICAGDAPFLDGQYAAFGALLSGLEEVYAIAALNTNSNGGPPSTPQIIKSVTVDTFGITYPQPDTLAER
jgi:peptidyl-prolyl cis-trans isomerase B (cyclophilin B)